MSHEGQAVAAEAQAQAGALPQKEEETVGGAAHLAEDRGQSRPGDPHAQSEHENGVQHDVQDSAQQHQAHADLGEALGQDQLAQARGEQGEDRAGDVYGKVGVGVGVGHVAGAEEVEHGTAQG